MREGAPKAPDPWADAPAVIREEHARQEAAKEADRMEAVVKRKKEKAGLVARRT